MILYQMAKVWLGKIIWASSIGYGNEPFFRLFSVFSVFAVVGVVVVVVIFTLHGIIFSLFGIYVKFLNNALHVAAYCCSEAPRMCESAEACAIKWRENLPAKELEQLETLVDLSRRTFIQFNGNDISAFYLSFNSLLHLSLTDFTTKLEQTLIP